MVYFSSPNDMKGQNSNGCHKTIFTIQMIKERERQKERDWQSKKQVSTALSSAEAEIYALAEAAKQARLAQWRAEELGIGTKWPIDIQVDNKAGISFQKATNPNTKLLGCFDLRDSWVSELRDKAQIKAVKVHTDNNCADLLTKCHSKQRFQHLVQLIRSKGMIQQAP